MYVYLSVGSRNVSCHWETTRR